MKYLPCLLLVLLVSFGGSLRADEQVEHYVAKLSERDHEASDGVALTGAADVLRQDRANYHKFGKRDKADEDDDYFADADHRAQIPNLLRKGRNTPEILKLIVNDTPTVNVTLFRGDNGLYLVVDNGD